MCLLATNQTLAWLVLKRFPPFDKTLNEQLAKVCPLWNNLLRKRLLLLNLNEDHTYLNKLKKALKEAQNALEYIVESNAPSEFKMLKTTNGYRLYQKYWMDFNREIHPCVGGRLAMQTMAKDWKSLSAQDRDVWNQKASDYNQRLKNDCYQKAMIKINNNPTEYRRYNQIKQRSIKAQEFIEEAELKLYSKYRILTDPF